MYILTFYKQETLYFFCNSLGQIIKFALHNKLFFLLVAHIRKLYYFCNIHANNAYNLSYDYKKRINEE